MKNGARLTGTSKTVNKTICRAVMRPSFSSAGSILIPALAYCSLYMLAMARKCGNCHRKSIAKSAHALKLMLSAAEVQPIKGGIAPGRAPIAVEADVLVFKGV